MPSLSLLSNPSPAPAVLEIFSRTVRAFAEMETWLADLQGALWARSVPNVEAEAMTTEDAAAGHDAFESEVLTAIRQGSQNRFREIVERYQGEISRRMWRFTRAPTAHEELVQEVFVEAYFSLKNYRGEAPFLHWLQRIATRTGYRHWKQQRDHAETGRSVETLSPQDAPALREGEEEQREAAELLEILMRRLSPEDRLVITLLHLEEYSVAEIARQTGWSESNVKVRAHRARIKLAEWVEERGHV